MTKLSQITSGGTILSIASLNGSPWIGSRAGLFTQTDGEWHPVVREIPFWGVSSVLAAGDDLLVAGLPNGLILSGDGGNHWRQATIEQTTLPITCLAASPSYHDDGVVLAGTAGDGMLRSSDGGRYWEVQSWGLDNLDVLAVATAPAWGRREYVVAATADGLYWSPNGGRAWRKATAPDEVIVPSLLFVSAEIILGGTESAGLIISRDGGRTWAMHPSTLDGLTVNALLKTQTGAILAATGEGLIGISADKGKVWEGVSVDAMPILSLCETSKQLLAGSAENGLLNSTNIDAIWQPTPTLSLHRFAWLMAGDQFLAAAGPETGVWRSDDRGQSWYKTPLEAPITHIAAAGEHLLAIRGRQVLQSDGSDVQVVFEPNDEPIWIETNSEQVWVGLRSGIAFRPNHDTAWRMLPVPFKQQTLLAFAVSGATILTVTQDGNLINFWRSDDAGQQWRNTFNERRAAATPRIALSGTMAAISIGHVCFVDSGSGWRAYPLGDAGAPIMALAQYGDRLLAISADATHQFDNPAWQTQPNQSQQPIVDLQQLKDPTSLIALTYTGQLKAVTTIDHQITFSEIA